MPRITARVACPITPSFRVAQVSALFDLPTSRASEATFSLDLPSADVADPSWQIGVIVGPSGSGKTTLARAAYGAALAQPQPWPEDRAAIDGFPESLSIQQITHVLTAVGFGSPPAWLRPYHVLSNGERFRCDLARALLGRDDLLVFDEFTSVVDRTVAQVASAAISKAIRAGRIPCRLVAVTCHRDVVPWLAPDWVADLATGELNWGSLRRPPLRLEVRRVSRSLWRIFARHHYLSGELNPAASCWGAFLGDGVGEYGSAGELGPSFPRTPAPSTPAPVSFCAVLPQLGWKGRKRISRIVTLPDFQGLGIGLRLVERVCEQEAARGFSVSITASHPAILAACRRSPRWQCTQFKPHGHHRMRMQSRAVATSHGRCVATFRWRGE